MERRESKWDAAAFLRLYIGWIGNALHMTGDWDLEDVLERAKEVGADLPAKEYNKK